MRAQFALLATRRFLPLWLVQITSAFGDNLFKSAFVMLVTFGLPPGRVNAGALSALAGASLVAPYFLFSSLAGELADKYDRCSVIRWLKILECGIALLAATSLISSNVWVALLTLFGLGAQATFISPVKYAVLPQHLAPDELVAGNALFEAATFLTVLAGTILGGIVVLGAGMGVYGAGVLLIASALLGLWAAYFVPHAPAPAPYLRLNYNPLSGNLAVLREAARQRPVHHAILLISWFWLVGAVLLTEFPIWAKTILGAGSTVVTWFLALFSLGIGMGAGIAALLVRGRPTGRFALPALVVLAVCCLGLCLRGDRTLAPLDRPMALGAFLALPAGWTISAILLALATAGGIFVVPLYALVQHRSDEKTRARIIAANNIWNAIYMTAATLAVAQLLQLGLPLPAIFGLLGLGSAGMAIFAGLTMSKRDTKRDGKAPGQRQLRVGEEIRHVLAATIERGDFRDPVLQNRSITVTEVRTSPDLRNATAFVIPLGGEHAGEIIAALQRTAAYLRGVVGRELSLRYVPQLTFELDRSFEQAARIDALMRTPTVQRDLREGDAAMPAPKGKDI